MRPDDVPSVPDERPVSSDRPAVGLLVNPPEADALEPAGESAEPRPVNYAFATGLAVVLLIVVLATFFLHRYQMRQLSTSLLQQSVRARNEGRLNDAARYLKHYVALAPDDAESVQSLAVLLVETAQSGRDRFEALQLLEQVLRDDPDNHQIRGRLATLCMQFGRYEDAGLHLVTLLQSSPDDAALHSSLGECWFAQDKLAEAVASYEAAVTASPRRIADYERLAAVLHEELDRADEAAAVMDRMIAANRQSAEAYLTRARYRQMRAEPDLATIDVERAFQLAPDDPDVLAAAAGLLTRQGTSDIASSTLRPDLVRARIDELISQEPDPRLFSAAAQLQLLAGRIDLSEQRLRAGLEAYPESIELSWRLTDLLIEQSRLEKARMQLADLKRQGASQLLIDYVEARLEMAAGEYLEASRRLEILRTESAVNQYELKVQINQHLGRCYERIGNAQRRLEAYRRLIDLAPASISGRIGLASALADLGRIDDAIVHYRQVLDVPGVAGEMARLLIVQNLRRPASRRDWVAVERVLDAARPGADQAELILLRAQLAEQQGRHEQADELLTRAVGRFPGNAAVWIARAAFQRRLGQVEAAQSTLAEAEEKLGRRQRLLVAQIETVAALGRDAARSRLDALEEELTGATPDEQTWVVLATAYERVGARQDAERIWKQIAERSRDNLGVWLRLFELGLADPDDARVQEYIDEMRRIEGDDGAYWRLSQARRLLGLARQGSRDGLPESRQLLAEIVGRLPTSPLMPLAAAELDELEGNPESAIEHYLNAIDRGALTTPVVRRTVDLLYRRQRYPEVERVLGKFRESHNGSLPAAFRRLAAGLALRTRDYETALELAREAERESEDARSNLWLGQILQASGRTDEAEESFRMAISLDRTLPESWIALIALLVQAERPDEARAVLSESQADVPQEQQALMLARCFELLGDDAQAGQSYERALDEQPHDPAVLWAFAEFQFRRGRIKESEPVLRTLLESGQSVPADLVAAARRTLALVLAMRGGFSEFREAQGLIESNLRENGNRPEDLRAKAKLLATQPIRRFQREAVSVLIELDEQVPLNATDQLQLVHLYLAIGHWPHARDSLQALLANHDDQPADLAFGVRVMLEHGEDSGMVVQWLDRLEELEADPLLVAELRARLQVSRNEFETALELLTGAVSSEAEPGQVRRIAVAADDVATQLDRTGRTAVAKRFTALAEKLYRRLVQVRQDEVLALVGFLGRHWRVAEALELCEAAWDVVSPERVAVSCLDLLRTGRASADDFSRVRRWIESALAQDPDSAELCFQLANVCHLQGDYPRAEELYRRTIALAPRTVLAYNELAILLVLRDRQQSEALELIDHAIELAGPLAFLLDTRAVVCLSLGRTEEARRDLEQAIADSPTPAKYFHLAQVYLESSDRPAADVAYRQGLAAGLHADALHPLERPQFEEIHAGLGQF